MIHGAGSVVRDKSLSAEQRLTTRKLDDEDGGVRSYLDILRTVHSESPDGGLTAYYEVDVANVFSMVIPEQKFAVHNEGKSHSGDPSPSKRII